VKILDRMYMDSDGKTIVHHQVHDYNDVLRQNAEMRQQEIGKMGDNWLIGRVPKSLITKWLKEAGVSWDDHEAVDEIIARKLNSNEFSHLRVVGGKL